jgi:hypothetical protein
MSRPIQDRVPFDAAPEAVRSLGEEVARPLLAIALDVRERLACHLATIEDPLLFAILDLHFRCHLSLDQIQERLDANAHGSDLHDLWANARNRVSECLEGLDHAPVAPCPGQEEGEHV